MECNTMTDAQLEELLTDTSLTGPNESNQWKKTASDRQFVRSRTTCPTTIGPVLCLLGPRMTDPAQDYRSTSSHSLRHTIRREHRAVSNYCRTKANFERLRTRGDYRGAVRCPTCQV